MRLRRTLRALALVAALLSVQGCSPVPQDRLPTPRGSVPVEINPGEDTYTDATEDMIATEYLGGSEEEDSVASSDDQLEKDLCDRVGEKAIEYSKIAAEDSTDAWIKRVLEADLIVDNREWIETPTTGELNIMIECFATIELSIGDVGTVTLFELLDSDENLRVRWEDYKPL